MLMAKYKTEINELITSMFGNQNIFTNDWYWSSTEYDASSSWNVNFNNGQRQHGLPPVRGPGSSPSPQTGKYNSMTYFLAVFSKHPKIVPGRKERVRIVLSFYNDYQSALVRLWYSIIYGEYVPDFSKVFIRTYPVYRGGFCRRFH